MQQFNTLPRSRRGGNAGGRPTGRERNNSGPNNTAEFSRPNRVGYTGYRGRGGYRALDPGNPEKPRFQGGIRRDNPQYHTFPKSRQRQPPDPQKYEPSNSREPNQTGPSHMGPSQKKIYGRKLQQQAEHSKYHPKNMSQDTLNTSFETILQSKSTSSLFPNPSNETSTIPSEPSNFENDKSKTKEGTGFKSYATTLAVGLDDILITKNNYNQKVQALELNSSIPVYIHHPIITLENPLLKGPPPQIPGLIFRSHHPLERRNSKKKRDFQEFSNETGEKLAPLETQTLKRRNSRRRRAPAKRSKSADDTDNFPKTEARGTNVFGKDLHTADKTLKSASVVNLEVDQPTKLKRRNSKRKPAARPVSMIEVPLSESSTKIENSSDGKGQEKENAETSTLKRRRSRKRELMKRDQNQVSM